MERKGRAPARKQDAAYGGKFARWRANGLGPVPQHLCHARPVGPLLKRQSLGGPLPSGR